jgi:prophage antirepressor-like protein
MVFDQYGEIWFGLKDLFRALGYESLKKTVYKFRIPKEYVKKNHKIQQISMYPSRDTSQIHPYTKLVNESGLYYVLSHSNKEVAKDFMNDFYTTIMPDLRKTGQFIMNKKEKDKIKKLNHILENLKNENFYLKDTNTYKPSKSGYMYILQTNMSIDGSMKKVYKIGITNNIKKRLTTYKTGNPNIKILYLIDTKLDKKQLESCIKNIMKFNIAKKKTEIIYSSLSKLLDDIKECSRLLINSICKCNKCKKKFNLTNIKEHECKDKLKIKLEKYN